MSDQHATIGAHEARIAELERQLAALQDLEPVTRSRMSPRRVAAFVVMLAVIAVPGVVLASHQFADVPTNHPFHSEIGWVAEKNIANGFTDGTYKPSNAVTRQAMAAFLQRLGTASPLEEEPNANKAAADLYPPAGPAMGGMMLGDIDYWRISHPGGDLTAETVSLDCYGTRSDTFIEISDSLGVIAAHDDIAGTPHNRCSRASAFALAAGNYFIRVASRTDVPWYALMVWAEGVPLSADSEAPATRPAGQGH